MKAQLRKNWQPHKLDELGFVGRGKSRHRPRNAPFLYGGPYPFIQTGDIKAADLYLTDYTQTYSEEGLAQSKLWEPGTLCITIAANIAETAILKIKACFPDSVVGFVPYQDKCDVKFIKYYIDTIKLHMQNVSRGTTQDNLSVDKLLTFDFLIPSLLTQKKIIAILSAYDDLIENNTRRIRILETMAQALYREWFIEFRFPGHEKVKRAKSSSGMIPEGWYCKYSDYVDFLEGPGLRNWQYRDDGIPFLNIRTLIANDIDFSKVQYLAEEEVEKKYQHFLLAPFDHVVSSSGTIGRIVTIQSIHLPLMLNTSIIRMRPKTASVGRWQLKHFLTSSYFQDQIKAFAIGAAQMNFGPSHLKQMWIIAPNEEIGRQYENIASAIEELICGLVRKNRNLRHTRDLLLTKLISGEVDVADLDINTGGLIA